MLAPNSFFFKKQLGFFFASEDEILNPFVNVQGLNKKQNKHDSLSELQKAKFLDRGIA